MKYDQFIKQVQNAAGLNSREEAERATRAVLETIRDRIVGNESKDLASQLPAPLSEYLHGREGENGDFFKMPEFIDRVSEKLGVDESTAVMRARAVFAVLQDAVTPGEFADLRANFSDDYAELFATPKSEAAK